MKVFLKWTATIVLLGVLAYSGVWLEKKMINALVEFPEEEVVEAIVNQDSLDWDTFTKALIWVESKGDRKAVGSNNDVGVLQITPILLRDCNRILEMEIFKLEDRLDSLKSVEMFNIIQDHYNPQHDYHWALKLWNSGAPHSYHRKVMDKFNEIKNEAL